MNILPAPELLALAGARRAIDHVDDALLLLLAARRRIVGALAPIKRNCGETARNPDRETQVHARAQRLARKLNVPDVTARHPQAGGARQAAAVDLHPAGERGRDGRSRSPSVSGGVRWA